MIKTLIKLMPMMVLLAIVYSCSPENKGADDKNFTIAEKDLEKNIDKNSRTLTIPVTTDLGAEEWSVESDQKWCDAKKEHFSTRTVIRIKVEANNDVKPRTANIKVNSTVKRYDIKVIQLGEAPAIIITAPKEKITFKGGEVVVKVSSNIKFNTNIGADGEGWVTINKEVPATRGMVDTGIHFEVKENKEAKERKATITFTYKEDEKLSKTYELIQSGRVSDLKESEVKPDVKIRVLSGTDTDHQGGQDITKSFDGHIDGEDAHMYHSGWGRPANFPVTLEYNLDVSSGKKLDYIIYHSRNGNGNFGQFELHIMKQGESTYKKVNDYDFKAAGGSHRIDLKESAVVSKVKFVVKSGLNNHVSCSEMEFMHYEGSELEDRLLTVFTDLSCTEVKAGVKDETINNLPAFFASMAYSIKQDTYDTEEKRFRIQEYSAYSTPEYWGNKLKINPYTHLNNPTGIIANANKEILVLVSGLKDGRKASLMVSPQITPGNQVSRPLKNGINTISFNKSGNVYVVYEAEDPRGLDKIKVHFPPQVKDNVEHAPVGFNVWDLNVEKDDAKFREYLRKAKTVRNEAGVEQCIFVLKGNKVVFTVLKELLANQDRHKGYGVKAGVERWDNLMVWEQELCGIDEFSSTGEFNTLMHVSTAKDGLYATHYYVNIAGGEIEPRDGWGFKTMFDPRDMDKEQDRAWGPGHELGHMHQGAINWPSTTESSNNLFSNYVVYKLNVWGSRGSSLSKLAEYRYAYNIPWARFKHPYTVNGGTVTFTPHDMNNGDDNSHGLYQGEDSETHMRMNQQLWTYFDRINKKPGTIKKIFQLGRQNQYILPWNNPGMAQLRYAMNVSQAAEMDMTEFFDTWGILTPVTRFRLLAYGQHTYEVTQEMIDNAKNYMKQFSTKCPPIQYIEDRMYKAGATGNPKGVSENGCDVGYFTTFEENKKVATNVSYAQSGRNFSVKNGNNAVAFELKKSDKVIWFSNRFNFTPHQAVNIDGAELYAVQADGQRIKVTKTN